MAFLDVLNTGFSLISNLGGGSDSKSGPSNSFLQQRSARDDKQFKLMMKQAKAIAAQNLADPSKKMLPEKMEESKYNQIASLYSKSAFNDPVFLDGVVEQLIREGRGDLAIKLYANVNSDLDPEEDLKKENTLKIEGVQRSA